MKKRSNMGYMLVETLIVTVFVAGVLIFLFVQFSKLNNSYDEYYIYNNTEDLYALADIKNFIENDSKATTYINTNMNTLKYIDITDCSSNIFTNTSYCLKLLDYEKIEKIYITFNPITMNDIDITEDDIVKFMNKISNDGTEPYRIVAKFDQDRFATIRLETN